MKPIINTIPFKKLPLEDFIPEFVNRKWYDIELHMSHLINKVLDATYIEKHLKKMKIHVMSGGWCNFFHAGSELNSTFDSINKQIKIMGMVGCDKLRLFLGELSAKDFNNDKENILVKNLIKLSDKYPNFIFLFETHNKISSNPKIMNRVFSKINRDNILINFDPANIELDGFESFGFLKMNYNFIGHIHIKGLKSLTGNDMKDLFCSYGEGILKYSNIFKLLKIKNYKGCLSFEYEGGKNPLFEINKSMIKIKKDLK